MTDALRPADGLVAVPEQHLRAVLAAYDVTEGVAVVGIRGYTKQFTGAESGGNLIGVYDDVICLVTPTSVHTYLGNTDPSTMVTGRAVLEAGKRYRYTRGIHGITKAKEKQYLAWVQAGPVRIRRQLADGTMSDPRDGQWIGCNIHKGGWSTTASAACQTIAPEHWDTFDRKLDLALKAAAQSQFWYVLTT